MCTKQQQPASSTFAHLSMPTIKLLAQLLQSISIGGTDATDPGMLSRQAMNRWVKEWETKKAEQQFQESD